MLTPAYYRRQASRDLRPRATLGPLRNNTAEDKGLSDRRQRHAESVLSLVNSFEPAPIDMAAFGKRIDEIITKAVGTSHKRRRSRT
jgi:hypothetical protein